MQGRNCKEQLRKSEHFLILRVVKTRMRDKKTAMNKRSACPYGRRGNIG
jgi:hypothetical protein